MSYSSVNHSHPSVDAKDMARGKAEYISDMKINGMLWGKVLRSPHPHALIKNIDIEEALSLPGVKGVITAEDTPKTKSGPFIPDWEILARDKVRFVGQEVAAVAAVDQKTAEEAVKLIKVEYEELPAYFTPEDALAEDAVLINPDKESNLANLFKVEHGDIEKGFAEADYVVERTFQSSTVFQGFLEPNGAVVDYNPFEDTYKMWAATQVPYKARKMYSQALDIPEERLRLIQARFGGGFGGKFENNIHLVAACLAKKVEGPVKLLNSMSEEFYNTPMRVPIEMYVKVGIDKEGKITAKEVDVTAENGGKTNYGFAVMSTAVYRTDSLYKIENIKGIGRLVYTNHPPKSAMRGFGNSQMLFALESVLDELAEKAELDPAYLRKKNSFENGDVSVHGWEIGSCGLDECIDKATKNAKWSEKRENPKEKEGTIRRGIGIGCSNHVSGYRPILQEWDGSSAHVRVEPSGKVYVGCGEVDMGQGFRTVAALIAAEELGVTIENIQVKEVDSDHVSLGIGSLGSRATIMGGNAVKNAASRANKVILEKAADLVEKPVEDLKIENNWLVSKDSGKLMSFKKLAKELTDAHSGESILVNGYYKPDTVMPDMESKYGNPCPCYPFAAHVAEVEVDMETGKIRLVNYVAANDVGKAINPLTATGQQEGGVVQGGGWVFTEDIVYRKGKIVNRNLVDYKMPSIKDAPSITSILVEEEDFNGPYGAKSLGENAFDPVAGAIVNAVYNATGIRFTSIPITVDKFKEALKEAEGSK